MRKYNFETCLLILLLFAVVVAAVVVAGVVVVVVVVVARQAACVEEGSRVGRLARMLLLISKHWQGQRPPLSATSRVDLSQSSTPHRTSSRELRALRYFYTSSELLFLQLLRSSPSTLPRASLHHLSS